MLRGPIRLVEVGRTEHNLNRSMNEMCLVERYGFLSNFLDMLMKQGLSMREYGRK